MKCVDIKLREKSIFSRRKVGGTGKTDNNVNRKGSVKN